jgi:hypothetical protein
MVGMMRGQVNESDGVGRDLKGLLRKIAIACKLSFPALLLDLSKS